MLRGSTSIRPLRLITALSFRRSIEPSVMPASRYCCAVNVTVGAADAESRRDATAGGDASRAAGVSPPQPASTTVNVSASGPKIEVNAVIARWMQGMVRIPQ